MVFAGKYIYISTQGLWWMFQPRYFSLFRQKECSRLQKDPEMRWNYHQLQGFFSNHLGYTGVVNLPTVVYSGKWRFTGIPESTHVTWWWPAPWEGGITQGSSLCHAISGCWHPWGKHLELTPERHGGKGSDDPFLLGETVTFQGRTGKLQVGNSLTKVTSRLPEIFRVLTSFTFTTQSTSGI